MSDYPEDVEPGEAAHVDSPVRHSGTDRPGIDNRGPTRR